MSRFAIALLMAFTALAGCVDDAADPIPEEPAPITLPPLAATLHDVEGATYAADPATVPVGAGMATGFGSFEPTIGVTSNGYLYMSNSEGGAVTSHSSIVRSSDGGATWQDITPKIGPVSTPPTTFDPYIHVDQDTDRVYNLDMEGLNCNYIQWSDDFGETFTGHPLGCGAPPVLDHPTLFTGTPRTVPTVGYDNVVYLCVNRVADAACAMSYDGGIAFTPFRPVFPEIPPSEGGASDSCGGLSGHGTTGPEGRAYFGRNHCGIPYVARTADDGVTWQTFAIPTENGIGGHDVEVAVDAAGNVYALWRDLGNDLRLAVSTNHGSSWGPDLLVSAPGIETAVFPAIAAGDDGRIAFTYYGTTSDQPIDDMNATVAWTAYLTTALNATEENPVFASTPISEHPIARGPCDDDNRCNGVGDFVDIVIDIDGRPWAGLFDSCAGELASECDGPGTGFLGTLRQGTSLRGDGMLSPLVAF